MEGKKLTLYLWEREIPDDFNLTTLELIISANSMPEWTNNKDYPCRLMGSKEFDSQAFSLSKEELFERFGIKDLNSYPGLPKGPYYYIEF